MKTTVTLITLGACTTLAGFAQMGPPVAAGHTVGKLELLYVGHTSADLDSGGDVSLNRYGVDGSLKYGLGDGHSIGLNAGIERSAYDFSGASAWGGTAPWEDIDFIDLGLSFNYQINQEQSLFIAPSLRFANERDADWNNGLEWGGVIGYIKQFSRELSLGIGGGAFTGMEDTTVFPFLFVYWQMSDHWRLSNPFRPGPSGPAGMEFVYTGVDKWEFGLGGGYRNRRFALDDDGIAADGYGQNEAAILFTRATYTFDHAHTIDLYLGTAVSGKLTLEDRKGHKLVSEDYDPALIAALAYSLRF
jgi:hypothetical protein